MQPLASTLFAPGEAYVAEEFGEYNSTVLSLMISVYVLGFGWGPLIYGPLSELYGRKYLVSISNLFFAVLNLGCSEAHRTGTFIAFRFLGSLLGSAGMVCKGISLWTFCSL